MTNLQRFEHEGFSMGSMIPKPHNQQSLLGDYHPPFNINPNKFRLKTSLNGNGKIVFTLLNGDWTGTQASIFNGLEFRSNPIGIDSIIWTGNKAVVKDYKLKQCIITRFDSDHNIILLETLEWINEYDNEEFTTKWLWIPN